MRVMGKTWAGLTASRTRRIVVVLALVCLVLTVEIISNKIKTEPTVEDPLETTRLLPVVQQPHLQTPSPEKEPVEVKVPVDMPPARPNKMLDVQKMQQNKVKEDLLKNLSDLDTKQLQKLWQMLDSTKDPHAIHQVRIDQSLQALKVRLLEEVSGQKYPDIMDAAQNARAISQQPRPKPLQIVIATTWRSGSTFLEELLASHPAVYNHYEPLMQFGLRQIRDGEDAVKAEKLVHDLLSCKYDGNQDYIKTAVKIKDMFTRNTILWQSCSSDDWGDALCYNEDYLKGACHLFPWSTMKIVRLRLKLLEQVLRDQKLNARIVYLVRDPRAVINSRIDTVKWCRSPDCNDPGYLCADMDDDLSAAISFQQKYPRQVYILRYEDLALNPVNKTRDLLGYLGLDFDPKMEEFLSTHTTKNYEKPWSTSRESKKRVTYWVTKLAEDKVNSVQIACSPVMERFGYLPINSTKNVTVEQILKPFETPLQ